MTKFKVVHVSTVHPANDVRIRYRECWTLANNGYDTTLLIRGPLDATEWEKLHLIALPVTGSRWKRALYAGPLACFRAFKMGTKVVHFHDPELLPGMFLLSLLGRKVVFDIHENLAEGLAEKEWLVCRKQVAWIYRWLEKFLTLKMNLVLAETSYEKFYKNLGRRQCTVLNYPDLSRFDKVKFARKFESPKLFYIGSISETRGFFEMLEITTRLRKKGLAATLDLVGQVPESLLQSERFLKLKSDLGDSLKLWGRLNLEEGYARAKDCNLGLAILHPMKNYVESLPTKLLEYMAVAMPVIASDFPFYKTFVEENDVGFCGSPADPVAIAGRIEQLFKGEEGLKKLAQWSERGPAVADQKYSWKTQAHKLLAFYESL